MSKENKMVVFKLLQTTTQKTVGEGEVVTTWGNVDLPSTYLTRDKNGVGTQKVISIAVTTNPKTGVAVPVPVPEIRFRGGVLPLMEGRDSHIINALRESVNNINFKYREPSDRAIFMEIDQNAERYKSVSVNDLIAEAYVLIQTEELESMVEYANAIGGIDTISISQQLAKANTKEKRSAIKSTPEYKALIMDLKFVAGKDPSGFMDRYKNPFRPFLASVNDGLARNVIGFNRPERSFHWKKGQAEHTFVKVPVGKTDVTGWLAEWFSNPDNQATYSELTQLIKAATN